MTRTPTKHVGTQHRAKGAAAFAARRLPAELRPEQVVAVVDSREQLPLNLSPLRSVAGTLTTGDYSVNGLESIVAVERKSLSDLLGCVGQHRERFDREVIRLLAYPTRAIVVESTWADIERGDWQSRITPAAAIGSLLGWIAAGVPVILAGDHERAGRYVSRLLFTAARRRWREARALAVEWPTKPTHRTVSHVGVGMMGLDPGGGNVDTIPGGRFD
jgi:DNA excision repair protein ERCC-4